MLQLKESLFLKLLWEQAGEEGKKIAAACLGSGIMQGLAVFSVLQGLQQLSEDGLEFSTFLAFLVSLASFYFLFRYITGRSAQIALRGIMNEAGAVLAGGHTVQDEELKYGLAVTGIIDPSHMARNDGLKPGQTLLLTKPLGTGVLATAVKARWDGAEESEAEVTRWCSRLNSVAGGVVRDLKIAAATDITGFGLGGHALEMAIASGVTVVLNAEALPLMVG